MEANEKVKLTKQQKRDKRRAAQVSSGLREAKVSKKQRRLVQENKGKKQQSGKGSKPSTSAAATLLPRGVPIEWNLPKKRLMTKDDEHFDTVLQRSYGGLRIDQPEVFDKAFHENMQKVLTSLTYDFDVVQPLGLETPLAQTKVKRVLVGADGMTYKYLGLRMFSLPFPEELKKCNSRLTRRTRELTKNEHDEE